VWQKTWQKKAAEEYQIVQEIAGGRDRKNPTKQGKTRTFSESEAHPN
jgi:hypothetical protein